MSDDPRAELASVAASLRAYLEIQEDSGAVGIPRGARVARSAPEAAPPPPPAPPTAPVAAPPPQASSHARESAPLESPQDRIATPEPNWDAPPTRSGGLGAPMTPQATVARVAAPSSAPSAPRRSLEVLQSAVVECTACALSETRRQTVFARGNPKAALCFVGEAPGADEDEQGAPFVGRAGQLLDKMISAMGLSPEGDVYVCNVIKCRPPGNRTPEPDELAACMPFLREQLENVAPKVIVALGNTATAALLGTTVGITRLRGEWKLYKGKTLVMPTYHPSYLLREGPKQQQGKKEAWDDLQKVMKELGLAPKGTK